MNLDETATPKDRKAPYVSYSAFKQFVDRYQRVNAPAKVDVSLLKMFNIASSNEWALISALKFLGLIEADGVPTPRFALIQATGERLAVGFKQLIEAAYSDFFAHGYDLEKDDFDVIRRYFATVYSVSQSERAAKFFLQVAQDAGYSVGMPMVSASRKSEPSRSSKPKPEPKKKVQAEQMSQAATPAAPPENLLQAKSKLLERLPTFDSSWQPEAIKEIREFFGELLMNLDETATPKDRKASSEESDDDQ